MAQITIEQAMQIAAGHYQAGRLAEAGEIYRQILAHYPDHADALHLLGVLAGQSGHLDAAINLIGRAIIINPTVAEYHSNLGETYRRSGDLERAIHCFRRAIELKPDQAESQNNLGIALKDMGCLDEAIASFHRAIQLRPDYAEAHCNLGVALQETGRGDQAIASYNRAIQLDPDLVAAHNNLGNTLWGKGLLDAAIDTYRRALVLDPDRAATRNNLGNIFREQGRLDEALACYRRAVDRNSDDSVAASNFVFTLNYHPDYDSQAILAEHRHWARLFAEPLATQIRPHDNDRAPDRRLRIGFVSPNLCAHPVGYLLLPLFSHRDPRRTEIVCYTDVKRGDDVTASLKALADGWRNTAGVSDQDMANSIRADRIDILVDLALHTAGNRLLVFARKPAPVQLTMLGMPSTTGLATIDYRLTDPYLDPPGTSETDYTERSIRLPHCYWCYQPPEESPPVSSLPAEKNGFVTFGCLNMFAKVTRPALQLWVKILQALPDARLVIQSQPGSHLAAVRALFQQGGIGDERVEFAAKATRGEYFERFRNLDLGLDPFPYNGHTSTLDALWMGVPIITLTGRTAVGRGGVSLLSNIGLTELIAQTPANYVAIALDWARDPARLEALRDGLRQRMLASPLMDGKQYAADVEAAFRSMWKTWCSR